MTDVELNLIWHGPEEAAQEGETIVAADPESGDIFISYGGGQIDHGYWAYAKDIFCSEMMMFVNEKELELRSWLEQERRQQEEKIMSNNEV